MIFCRFGGKGVYTVEPWLIALIAILIVHYFCAIFTIWILLKDKLVLGGKIKKAPLLLWNLFILFIPFIGAASYLICRAATKRKAAPDTQEEKRAPAQNGEPTGETPDGDLDV